VWLTFLVCPIFFLPKLFDYLVLSLSQVNSSFRTTISPYLFTVNLVDQPSISSTLYARIFCTNVVLAAFTTYILLEKKLPKWLSYEKSARIMLMKLTLELKISTIRILTKETENSTRLRICLYARWKICHLGRIFWQLFNANLYYENLFLSQKTESLTICLYTQIFFYVFHPMFLER